MEITVVCASDDGYVMPLAAALASARYFLGPGARLRVFVLDAGILPGSADKLRKSLVDERLDLTFVPIGASVIRDQPGRLHINWVAYSKLLIPCLLPHVTKAIWLDCDLVVCDDLSRLWQCDLHGKAMLAVAESTVGRTLPFAPDYGVALDAPYFNAGVIVLDLDALRRLDFTPRAERFLADNAQRLPYLDQDVFNIVGAHDWHPLDPLWNFVVAAEPPSLEAVARARSRPHPWIVHYASVPKPWHWGYGYLRAYSSYFFFALDLTEWRGWQPPLRARQLVRARFPTLYESLKRLRRHLPGGGP